MPDDKELLRRLLTRDKKAVREFYVRFSSKLLRFIRIRIHNESDVEEIAQDTLFAFLEGLRDFNQNCSFSTYLFTIAGHKIIDFYRKRRIKRIVFSQLPQGIELLISELTDPQKIFDDALLTQKIKHVLSRLTPRYARMLKLKYIEGRSVVEIARTLAISFKAAESILFRARREFVKLYEI